MNGTHEGRNCKSSQKRREQGSSAVAAQVRKARIGKRDPLELIPHPGTRQRWLRPGYLQDESSEFRCHLTLTDSGQNDLCAFSAIKTPPGIATRASKRRCAACGGVHDRELGQNDGFGGQRHPFAICHRVGFR